MTIKICPRCGWRLKEMTLLNSKKVWKCFICGYKLKGDSS